MTNIKVTGVEKYELVIGLEVHAQLSTVSKIFAPDLSSFGGKPNTYISPISLGHPGTLPCLNVKAVEYAIKMAIAVDGNINLINHFARKNYFYADLPKGYQISQDIEPICIGGCVTIKLKNGDTRKIAIHHIHMEEDAGKSIHDQHKSESLIDLNRAGVALLEIVSEPDMHSAEEAQQYLNEIRRLLRYLDICDGNMEEGSMRCDANISIRLKGSEKLGNRCEVKNMNSIRNVQRAIEHEFLRQVSVMEAGGVIEQNTLNFDADSGETSVMRSKEMANDYRYFPDPDLPPVVITKKQVQTIRDAMPALPHELFQKYTKELGLSDYDASIIIADKGLALYFEDLITLTSNYKAVANWMIGPIKSLANETGANIDSLALKPAQLIGLIQLVDDGKVSNSIAAQKILPHLFNKPTKTAEEVAVELNLIIDKNTSDVSIFIKDALSKHPDKVSEYHKGKKGVLGLFMGEIMKTSKGKIDPKKTNQLLIEVLESSK